MSRAVYYDSIRALGERIRTGATSPVEVTRACLARIEALGVRLNAFITVLGDAALKQAAEAEQQIRAGHWRGPLHGIPVGVKDFYDTAGVRTTAAFEHFKDRVPVKDAVAVGRLRDAGAIVVGKTNMHTLGMGTTGLASAFGPARNPWNAEYIPGGSSSGSAAAVASGLCYATLDTDAVGSARLPAACCGVVGFKATYGRISTEGILAGEQDPGEFIRVMSHAAVITRTVEDAAILLDALAGTDVAAVASEDGGGLRIGVGSNIHADAEIRALFTKAVAVFREAGLVVVEVPVPFGDPNRGLGHVEADRQSIGQRAFQDVDVIVLPTLPAPVPTVAAAAPDPEQGLPAGNTAFANYYGLPAVTVPCGFDARGLPVGLQIVGKPGDERRVLQAAFRHQQASRAGDRHPIE
jgi:aspartyl-tRNA(Asn)/glutamyl-tRNA(Gln) amidotransferase subunit A